MRGSEILKSVIGKPLVNGKIQSFILDGELVDRINVTFLKFDEWIRIVSTDDMTWVALENNFFEDVNSYGDNKFYYPIDQIENHFSEFSKYKGKKLINWKELVWYKDEELSYGVNLYFENNLNLIIHNQVDPIDENQFIFQNQLPKDLIEKNN